MNTEDGPRNDQLSGDPSSTKGSQGQAPYEGVVRKAVERIRNEPFLFVIAIAALLAGLTILATRLESADLRFVVLVVAVLALAAILVYYRRHPEERPAAKASLLLPTPTGDAQIDNVLEQLRSTKGGAESPPIDVLFGQLHMLFKRAAFEVPVTDRDRTNPDDWKQLLFVASLTEQIVRGCHPAVKARGTANQLQAYDDLRRELIGFGRCIANVFGDGFNLASYLNDPGTERDRFLGGLPEPSNTEHGDSAERHRIKVCEIVSKLF